MDDNQRKKLAQAIADHDGKVRVFIHPDYEEYSAYGFTSGQSKETLLRQEQAFRTLLTSDDPKLPPQIIFLGSFNRKSYADKADRIGKLTENDVYLVQTEAYNPTPIEPSKTDTYRFLDGSSTREDRAIIWDLLNEELHDLGVTDILLGGLELGVDTSGEDDHQGCVGYALNRFDKDFNVEMSQLTWPDRRKPGEQVKRNT